MKLVEATKTMNIEKVSNPIEVLVVENNPCELWSIQQILEKAKGTSFHISRADLSQPRKRASPEVILMLFS